jgi:hypothetical protein
MLKNEKQGQAWLLEPDMVSTYHNKKNLSKTEFLNPHEAINKVSLR